MLELPKLVRHLRSQRPEIVIAAANNMALIAAIAFQVARIDGARLYLKTTNPIASSRHTGLIRAIRRASYRAIFGWMAGVWTLSPEESREMIALYPEHAQLFRDVFNPYVTPAMLTPVAAAPPPRAGAKRVIAVARLERQKRLERLIRAFALVGHADAELLILGEGEERAALTALIDTLGLRERVSMPGHVADVATPLRTSDLSVLTSDYEGLPAAVLESMAANCPVLSTDCFPSARALLESSEGCGVIDSTEPAALAAQIDRFLDHPRPTRLRAVAERYSIASGIASHVAAMLPPGVALPAPQGAASVR